ncbi:PepSY domain-containing protein [uncultured Pseudosulfitobacter sp.]|uniref:PepSY domain-containing protein n=1 Tax=uncultured Pseudosulfitobacter sp. TaxID=2854214 RepID=UPI0030D7E3DF
MRIIALITLMAFAAPAFAADLTADTMLGKTMDEVKATLTDMGYEVRKAEMEDGNIEVYFVKDGKMGEVYVNPETGAITKLDVKN